MLQQPTSPSQAEADRLDPPLIANNTIIATSYKNNSLPLEEAGDDLLVMLTKEAGGYYYIRIPEFNSQSEEWTVYSVPLPTGIIPFITSPKDSPSLAFCDDTATSGKFLVFLGYGSINGTNWIGYFIFDSSYQYVDHGEFESVPPKAKTFCSLTVAPSGFPGFCRLIVGFDEAETPYFGDSGFEVGNLIYRSDTETVNYSKYYVKDPLEVKGNKNYTPNGLTYLGVVEQDDFNDLVILIPGPIFPQDDVVFIQEIRERGGFKESWDRFCSGLRDYPNYFSRVEDGEKKNIAIVRGVENTSFVRYAFDPGEAHEDTLIDYKIDLGGQTIPPPPIIPDACKLFHMDSGDMDDDGEDDLAVIWKYENEEFAEIVLCIKEINPVYRSNCKDIDFETEFVPGFNRSGVYEFSESMYIRHTSTGEGYCLSLFYHDNETPTNVRVHVEEFSLQ